MRDDEVEEPVLVVVEEGGADGEQVLRLAVEPRAGRDVGEGAVAVVAVEGVRAGIGDEEVGVPVVVEVPGRDAEREVEVLARDVGLRRHLLERAVPAPAEQAAVVGGVGPGVVGELPPVGEEDVDLAVPVVVDEGDPAAHGLREVLARGEVVVRGVGEGGLARHVGEADGRRHGGKGGGRRGGGLGRLAHAASRPRVARPRLRAGLGGQAERGPRGRERQGRRGEEQANEARSPHFSGSFTTSTWFDATFSRTCTTPLGQRTSSFVTVSSFPSPKCTRTSEAPP